MTQGIFINYRRPKSKKQIKEAIAENPSGVSLEATSLRGNEYDGPVSEAPVGSYTFVGPDPYRNRKFYGQIIVKRLPPHSPTGEHVTVVVK